jgi:hypothetical protein
MVALYTDLFRRGRTEVRTSYVVRSARHHSREQPHRIERTMADASEHERLRDLRMHFQYRGLVRASLLLVVDATLLTRAATTRSPIT